MHPTSQDPGLLLEGERVRLSVDRASGTVALTSVDGRVALAGMRAGADVGGRCRLADHLRVAAIERSAAGEDAPTAVRLEGRLGDGLELELRLELAPTWRGARILAAIVNRGSRPVALRRILPLCLDTASGGGIEAGCAPGSLRVLRMGYQSWTPAEYVPISGRASRPRLAFVRRMHQGPFTPAPRRGLHVSDFVTTLRGPLGPGITVGFTSHDRYLNHVTLAHRRGLPRRLEAVVATEDRVLEPGERARGEPLWVGIDGAGPPQTDGIAEWADRTGHDMGARVPGRSVTAWCSWYQFFTRVSADDVIRNVDALAPFQGSIDTIQIDDGFQSTVGDWLTWDPGFPGGVAPVAAKIRAAGFGAGIWLAPFLVSRASRVAREHPEWLLRSRAGRPIVANVNPLWKGVVCWALDPTHPGVLAWLEEVVGTLARSGFSYLKLDFLYAGALAGRRHDPGATAATAYRRGIETIRRAAGPEVFLLGCGAPLGPSVGLFEAMRIGADVAPRWRSRAEDAAAGMAAAPSARNALYNVVSRASLHRRLWLNDPDCVLLRDRDTKLDDEEVRTIAGAAFVSGGLLVLSDDLANLSPPRRALLERLLPPPEGLAEPGPEPLDDPVPGGLVRRLPDGSLLWIGVNLRDADRTSRLDLARLGLEGDVHVYDVWDERYLGRCRGTVRVPRTAPHGSTLLRLTPADGVPRVVGSTTHLSGGSHEIRSVEPESTHPLRVRVRLAERREGDLLLDPGSGRVVVVRVEGAGPLEFVAPGVQIEAGADRPDGEEET